LLTLAKPSQFSRLARVAERPSVGLVLLAPRLLPPNRAPTRVELGVRVFLWLLDRPLLVDLFQPIDESVDFRS